MPDAHRREKLISIRLSELEYQLLKTRYRMFGARNVSDFARIALDQIMGRPVDGVGSLAERLKALDQRLGALEARVLLMAEAPVEK